MVILSSAHKIFALSLTLTIFASSAGADQDDLSDARLKKQREAIAEQAKSLCNSTQEFTQTLKFLRETEVMTIPENTARMISEKVSRGCDGAADRFAQVLTLLKTSGLSDRKTLEMSLEFSAQSPEIQKSFSEIFTHAFLGEFFDYDYALAARLAYELSRDYQGNPAQVRDDFIEIVHFCKEGKSLDLPTRLCAEFTVKLARLSQLYPEGVRQPFYKLFKELRNKPDFGLDMKTSLEVSYNILKNGPRAPENFYSAYKYALHKDGLALSQREALTFALKMAARSYKGEEPPVFPILDPEPKVSHASNP